MIGISTGSSQLGDSKRAKNWSSAKSKKFQWKMDYVQTGSSRLIKICLFFLPICHVTGILESRFSFRKFGGWAKGVDEPLALGNFDWEVGVLQESLYPPVNQYDNGNPPFPTGNTSTYEWWIFPLRGVSSLERMKIRLFGNLTVRDS